MGEGKEKGMSKKMYPMRLGEIMKKFTAIDWFLLGVFFGMLVIAIVISFVKKAKTEENESIRFQEIFSDSDKTAKYAIIDKTVEATLRESFYDVKECSRLNKGKYSDIAVILMPAYGFPCKTKSGKNSSCSGTYSPLKQIIRYTDGESFRHEVLHYLLDVNGKDDIDHENPLFKKCPDGNWKVYEKQEAELKKERLQFSKTDSENKTSGMTYVTLGPSCDYYTGELTGVAPNIGTKTDWEGWCRNSYEREIRFQRELLRMDSMASMGYREGFSEGRGQYIESEGKMYDTNPWIYLDKQKALRKKARLGKGYQCKESSNKYFDPIETCTKTDQEIDVEEK